MEVQQRCHLWWQIPHTEEKGTGEQFVIHRVFIRVSCGSGISGVECSAWIFLRQCPVFLEFILTSIQIAQ